MLEVTVRNDNKKRMVKIGDVVEWSYPQDNNETCLICYSTMSGYLQMISLSRPEAVWDNPEEWFEKYIDNNTIRILPKGTIIKLEVK